jgi:nucleoside-diphosphate-sugar epimerase
MKYLVTGATGFVGGVLTRKLREQGHNVNALVRDPERAKELRTLGVKLFKADVTDKESMREGMTGVDGVYHVAGWYKVVERVKGEAASVNIQGTRNVLELMQELQIPKGVYTSSCVVNSDTHGQIKDETYHFTGRHISEYDRTKAVAHMIAADFMARGLPLVIVMPGVMYGPGDTSVVRTNLIALLKGELPVVPDKGGYCWAHVDDAVQGHILAMEKGQVGETYMICGETYHSADAFQLASEISGKRAPRRVPYRFLKALSYLIRPFDAIMPDIFTSEGLRVIAGVTYFGDNSKARRELGFNPRPFREGWGKTLLHEMKLLGIN